MLRTGRSEIIQHLPEELRLCAHTHMRTHSGRAPDSWSWHAEQQNTRARPTLASRSMKTDVYRATYLSGEHNKREPDLHKGTHAKKWDAATHA